MVTWPQWSLIVISDFAHEYALKVGVRNLHAHLNMSSFYFELSNIVTPFLGYNFSSWFVNMLMLFTHSSFRGQNYQLLFFIHFSHFLCVCDNVMTWCSKLVICLSLISGIFRVFFTLFYMYQSPASLNPSKQRSSYILILWDVVAIKLRSTAK